jgi:hypothetical protein
MARFHKLRIYHLAMDILKSTHAVLPQFRGYGELRDSVRNLSHILAKCLCVMMKFSSVVRTRLAAVFDGGPAFDAAGPLQGPKQ